MDAIEAILSRRSVRGFSDEDVSDNMVRKIVEAARWAPSGLNNQPWRFIIVRNQDTKTSLSMLTNYGPIIKSAPLLIVVFLDKDHMYNYVKDVQSSGASVQNMLLAIHALGLGGVWLGEILKNREAVNKILEAPDSFELMAVIALGHPAEKKRVSERKELSQLVFKEKFGKNWSEGI